MPGFDAQEQATLWRLPEFHYLELLKATYTTHAFARHWHDTYVIEVVEQGADEFFCRGVLHTAPAGSIIVIHPAEVHTGRAVGGGPMRYRSLYPAPELLLEIVGQPGDGASVLPWFPSPVIRDPALAGLIQEMHRAAEAGGEPLAVASLLVAALTCLVQRHAARLLPHTSLGDEREAIKRVKAFLVEHLAEPVALADLADLVGLSPFHLLRVFRREVGVPPHAYLTNLRVEQARRLLRQGLPIALAASASGFYDQSHLNRHFRRILGVTPGEYVRQVRAG